MRKLKAMFASGTMVSMQLSPLVSMKSCRVMAVGSMWCSLNGRIKAFGSKNIQAVSGNVPHRTPTCLQTSDFFQSFKKL